MSSTVKERDVVNKAKEVIKDLSGIEKENMTLKVQLDWLQDSVAELQKYASEDFEGIASLVDRVGKVEEICCNITTTLEEIAEAVDNLSDNAPTLSDEEEKMYKFLGLEAPKSFWVRVAKGVAAALVAVGALYVGYHYLNKTTGKENNGTIQL